MKTVIWSEKAYAKLALILVTFNDTEVAWHGLVEKRGNDEYYISDLLVYPQMVSGASVDTNDTALAMWYSKLSDESMKKLRMQGHSHVRMMARPSQTDRELYSELLKQLREDDFYIFMICNLRKDVYSEIYDAGEVFDNNQVNHVVEECEMNDFVSSIVSMVCIKKGVKNRNGLNQIL